MMPDCHYGQTTDHARERDRIIPPGALSTFHAGERPAQS